MNPLTATDTNGWLAELDLEYRKKQGKTFLSGRRHQGPLVVQKAFYPEGHGVCHSIVVHPPGGVTGNDRLNLNISIGENAHALVTTPAAGKFYRNGKALSRQAVTIKVEPGAVAEWLPMENILYPECRARLETRVELDANSLFMGWDILCLGLPASGRPFDEGRVFQGLEIIRDGRPLFIEKGMLDPCDGLNAPWITRGKPVIGMMAVTAEDQGLVARLRDTVCPSFRDDLFTVTQVNGLLICRFLGTDAFSALSCFTQAWQILRPALTGRTPCAPRIWKT